MPAEITLIGGAAILANYGFRDSTTNIDALIEAASSMKEAINHVTEKGPDSSGPFPKYMINQNTAYGISISCATLANNAALCPTDSAR